MCCCINIIICCLNCNDRYYGVCMISLLGCLQMAKVCGMIRLVNQKNRSAARGFGENGAGLYGTDDQN